MSTTDELRELRQAADRQRRKGFYGSAAVAANERILELEPSDAAALLRLAHCHVEDGRWRAAHDCYRRLLALGVGDPARIQDKLDETLQRAEEREATKRLAEERTKQAEERKAVRRHELVEEAVREAGAIDGFIEARTLAIALRDAGDPDVALVYHERSLELARSKGDMIGALAAQASTLRRAGRPSDALIVLRRSIELEPSRERNKPSYTSLVATLRELDQLDEARREGELLLAIFPDDSWVLFAMGRLFKELAIRDRDPQLLDRAQGYYDRAAALQPGRRDILAELKSLVAAYDNMADQLGLPDLVDKARLLERRVADLESKFASGF